MSKRKIVNDASAGAEPSRRVGQRKTKRKTTTTSCEETVSTCAAQAEVSDVMVPAVRDSNHAGSMHGKWRNKQRVLVFSSRGIGMRDRHLMKDFKAMMPHSRGENKMNKRDKLVHINESCEMRNCNTALYFEARKKTDLYMWIAKVPNGPSAKFLVENIHTMDELKMTGNCLRGSRPVLSFDKGFHSQPHWALLLELFVQIFNTPRNHPKSQPFTDRVLTFSLVDNRIWIRNYQIVEEDGALAEIGPRLTLNLIKIFDGSFRGECLYENAHYVSPNLYRHNLRLMTAKKYINRVESRLGREAKMEEGAYPLEDQVDDLYRRAQREEQAKGKEKPMETLISQYSGKKKRIKRLIS